MGKTDLEGYQTMRRYAVGDQGSDGLPSQP